MYLRMSVLCAALMLAGCSKSSVQLLKEGDPKVCTQADVTDQLFEIIKEHASFPGNNGFIEDYDKARQKWLSEITFSINQVTSKNVDKPDQKITCNGLVHMDASETGQQDANVDYVVKSDLSDGKPIVEADLSNVTYPISVLLNKIASPDLREARAAGIQRNIAKADHYEKEWLSSHADEAKSMRENIEKTVQGNHFSQDEKDTAFRIEVFNKICLAGADDERALGCSRRDSLLQSALGSGTMHLCHRGDFSGWKHCDGTDVVNAPAAAVAQPSSDDEFTPEENKIIKQADYLNDKCRGGAGDQTDSFCNQRDNLYNKMKGINICWGPEDAAGYEQHWIHCHPK